MSHLDLRSHCALARAGAAFRQLAASPHAWPPYLAIHVTKRLAAELRREGEGDGKACLASLRHLRPRTIAFVAVDDADGWDTPFMRSVSVHGRAALSLESPAPCRVPLGWTRDMSG